MGDGLVIQDLRVTYPGPPPVRAVDGLSLTVGPGQCLGILGESGCGKSTVARSLLGLLDDATVQGSMRLGDLDLTALDEAAWREVRWRRIALGFQSTASLNPVLRVGRQLSEPFEVHLGHSRRRAASLVEGLLDDVGLGGWAAERYPSELSGGQRRLVLLAMALACDPEVLILDEPTAGLDPVTREHVLALLARLQAAGDRALVLLGHDADALDVIATHVAVMYRGWPAEIGPAADVLNRPRSPYGWALLNARPTLASVKDLRGIRGDPPDPTEVASGCPFLGRCTQVVLGCEAGRPPMLTPHGETGERTVACIRGGLVPILRAKGLRKAYRVGGALRSSTVLAVDGIDLEVRNGEAIALIGATGAGKTTLAMVLAWLLTPDEGSVEVDGLDLASASSSRLKAARRRLQLLFQDPYEAVSTRLDVRQIVREPLDTQNVGEKGARDGLVRAALEAVRLPSTDAFLARFSHQMSGGQLQRVALARSLVLSPKVLIADEPVAMLDPSEQSKVLQLLKGLQVERGMTLILISHDMATVLRVADRVLVLDGGRIVEEGTGSELLLSARHPVTRSLLGAAGAPNYSSGRFPAPAMTDGGEL